MNDDEARAALTAKRAQVLERLAGLDKSFDDIVEAARDSNIDDEHDPEGSTIAVSRQQTASFSQAARQQLDAIDAALARVNDGSYGRCVTCGEPIPDGRLEAIPEASQCISCRSKSASQR